jgi:hypothetical protein
MKKVRIIYTIFDSIEVDDDATPSEIENCITDSAIELGLYNLADDVEWFIDD